MLHLPSGIKTQTQNYEQTHNEFMGKQDELREWRMRQWPVQSQIRTTAGDSLGIWNQNFKKIGCAAANPRL